MTITKAHFLRNVLGLEINPPLETKGCGGGERDPNSFYTSSSPIKIADPVQTFMQSTLK